MFPVSNLISINKHLGATSFGKYTATFTILAQADLFLRITTSPLQSKFMWQLDHFSDKLLKIFKSKGGLKGHNIKEALAISDSFENIHIKRVCILRSIAIYLNEDPDSFFKEYQVNTRSLREMHRYTFIK
ncbi:hypothetical protein KUCAC02_017466 [Chaenocephalus aceratus]|uniref:Uncharacterized protein n=1 Tax=Chaenocephalus aceratus TaxID=36190 RepID=A0ACB9W284_CHAAC|nr:hypothetical protein KUCAC02_017466 [Chaenocephalus aceratus]